jgi:asparagine synthase (glutamine-hydrolysing)
MCRITGVIHPNAEFRKDAVQTMCDAMRRGGPDDFGQYHDPEFPLSLGHRRLSIIDLSSGGHQPMYDPEHQLWIVFNGEIYNFQELKQELTGLGHQFRSQSDTEVILKAYAQWGTDAFRRLNGMFALALLDRPRQQLILARDHAGIKPLYFSVQGDQLVFASEVRAFKALNQYKENADWKTMFLAFGHLPEPETTLEGVQSLPKNHFFRYDFNTRSGTTTRFDRIEISEQIKDEREAVELVRRELRDAVQRQLISDAPIGLFLSGGIDSSVLTLLAKPFLGDNLHTASIIFDEAEFSEKPFQDQIIASTGAHHSAFTIRRQDFDDSLPDILNAMDQPTNDGINSYFISRIARAAGLKVALSGLGADELLGGYPSFQYAPYIGVLRKFPRWSHPLLAKLPDDRWKKMFFFRLPGLTGEYLFYRGLFTPRDIAHITGDTESQVIDILAHHALEPGEPPPTSPRNRAGWLESNYYMQNQLLRDTDSMSMWHGLEVRVPFLDRQFMQKIWTIDPEVKFNHKMKKHLLIKAFEQELPRAIWDRPKRGFTFPFVHWFRQSERLESLPASLTPYKTSFMQNQLSWARFWVIYLSQMA